MNALGQQESGGRVAQIVNPHAGQFRGRKDVRVGAFQVARFQGRSNRRGENEPALLPARAGEFPFPRLAPLVFEEL